MDKREFLKSAGALAAGSLLSRAMAGEQLPAARTNWSGNLTYGTNRLLTPATVEDLCAAVKSASKLRVLGARHSFSAIADSTHEQISLERFDEMTLDEKARTVTVGGGVTYSRLAPWLDARGYALHNLASLPHITVAGACATGTHGSGVNNGNLATPVSALEMVTAAGEIVRLRREVDGARFLGAVVGLGSLGAVTRTTLDVQPTYKVAQSVYRNLSFDELGRHFDEIFSSGYSVSVFTDWQQHRATQVWVKRRLQEGDANHWAPELFGARLATQKLHPAAGYSPENCTEQEGIPGPWYDRLPHFRIGMTPSSGQELQTEYFVPYELGWDAVQAVEKLHEQIGPHLIVTELRTVAADELWMSMAYRRPALTVHFTWKPEWPAVRQLLPLIEAQLKPFDPRPHWAKMFTLPGAQVAAGYRRLAQFKALTAQLDPTGKFRNQYLERNLYAD